MSKADKTKRAKLKAFLANDAASPKQKRHPASFFGDGDDLFDASSEPDEWNKLLRGESSKLDAYRPDDEYLKAAEQKPEKQQAIEPQSLLDDDDGETFITNIRAAPVITPTMQQLLPPRAIQPIPPPRIAVSADDEEEAKNLALRLAEDFAKREHVILVGEAPFIYNGRFYTLLRDDAVQRAIFSTCRKEVARANTVAVLRNASALLRYCIQQVYEEFPTNEHLLVFENGTLDLTTGVFRENSPDDLASSALSISYDPSQKKIPWTKHFLMTIADGDDELYERLLQVIGYLLSNNVKAKAFFYLEGVGDAGKSRFCDLIASFFPVSGTNKVARIALQDLGGKFALSNLVNAKLNISEDLPDSPLSPTTVSRIKMISDGNRLEAEAKYVQAFSFRPLCKLLFASNHSLRLKEYDAAFVNRVVYIPFLHPIPKEKQDKHILEKMQGELPALFNHALGAYCRLVTNGYAWAGADRFKPNITIANSGLSIDKKAGLKRFVDDCCEFDGDAVTPTNELQASYADFCCKHSYPPVLGDRFSRELATVLPATVVRVKIGNQKRGFKGIRLKASAFGR